MAAQMAKHDTIEKRGIRSANVSVTFPDGFAAGWFVAAPHWFRISLDIEKTERVKTDSETGNVVKHPGTGKSVTEMIWTEGEPQIYKFSVGDTLYDVRAAYESVWENALREITFGLQVVGAMPDRLGIDRSKDKIHGWVRVAIYRPNSDKSRIETHRTLELSQTEFVHALKTGFLPKGESLRSKI